ncbi:hypothetical protein SF123566_7301 [Shigella flexneri 1235-66]|nr:hypothetical protein SF123566_7301 [Shigella flexneri 1235-66]
MQLLFLIQLLRHQLLCHAQGLFYFQQGMKKLPIRLRNH